MVRVDVFHIKYCKMVIIAQLKFCINGASVLMPWSQDPGSCDLARDLTYDLPILSLRNNQT